MAAGTVQWGTLLLHLKNVENRAKKALAKNGPLVQKNGSLTDFN